MTAAVDLNRMLVRAVIVLVGLGCFGLLGSAVLANYQRRRKKY